MNAFYLNNDFLRVMQVSEMHIYNTDGIQEGRDKRYESINNMNNNRELEEVVVVVVVVVGVYPGTGGSSCRHSP